MKKVNKAEIDLKLAIIARDLLYDYLGSQNKAYAKLQKRLRHLQKEIPASCHSDAVKNLEGSSRKEAEELRLDVKEKLRQVNKVIIKADAKKIKDIELIEESR